MFEFQIRFILIQLKTLNNFGFKLTIVKLLIEKITFI